MQTALKTSDYQQLATRAVDVTCTSRLPLPSTVDGIARYVEQLLTPKEERVCDMATD